MRDLPQLLFLVASVGNLFLATLVIFRARRARGALPIALLCLSLFVWDIAEAAKPAREDSDWHYIRLVGSSMAPAFLWHFVVVFVQRERDHRKVLRILYAITAIFTLMTAGALVNESLRKFVRGPAWNIAYLAALFPFLIWSFVLVRARRREVETPVERNAVNFVTFGIAVGVLTGMTELVHVLWPKVPRLGHAGSALCTLVLAVAILRHRLLEQQTPVRTLFFLFLLTASAVVVVLVIYKVLPDRWDPVLVFGVAGGVAVLALYRMVFVRFYEQAERRKRLALIGTMAAGVAHEIRNPLAAIKGAAQFVQKDLEGTAGKDEAKEYLQLLVNEVDRLNGVVESFLTYARPLEPRRQDLPLDTFLADLVKLQAASIPPPIRIETSFAADLPPVPADPALLTTAVSNVLRNAVEVMPEGGTLSIRTRTVVTALRTYAAIDVADTGPGLPRAERERIFQPFYTTKAKGTGLGLAIALRILEAHGGDIAVENLPARGCRFTFLLPLPIL